MVQTGEISFAGKVAYNIKMDESKQRIMEELDQKFHFKVIQKHHERYTNDTLSHLNNNPHLITVRTNGNPYLLYLTQLNYVNQCVFIDKKVQQGYFLPRIILSKFRFDDALFKGTLMDGEMIKDKSGSWIFLICDLLGHKGVYLDNVNVVKRLNILYHMLDQQFVSDEFDVCHFQVKKHFAYEQLETIVMDFIPNLPYTCRGIYFKPLFLKFKDILFNFDDTLIQKVMRKKYKSQGNFLMLEDTDKLVHNTNTPIVKVPSQSNVLVSGIGDAKLQLFYVTKTSQPDVYHIFDRNNKNQGNACVPTLKASKMLRALFTEKNLTDRILMKCEFSEKFEKYIPISPASVK